MQNCVEIEIKKQPFETFINHGNNGIITIRMETFKNSLNKQLFISLSQCLLWAFMQSACVWEINIFLYYCYHSKCFTLNVTKYSGKRDGQCIRCEYVSKSQWISNIRTDGCVYYIVCLENIETLYASKYMEWKSIRDRMTMHRHAHMLKLVDNNILIIRLPCERTYTFNFMKIFNADREHVNAFMLCQTVRSTYQ